MPSLTARASIEAIASTGVEDALLPYAYASEFAAQVRDARVVLLESATHGFVRDVPQFVEVLAEFVGESSLG